MLERLDSIRSPHPRHSNPHSLRCAIHVPPPAVSLYGAFLVKEFATAANRLSFVSFFVRSQSPFLRPDPRFADVVARRSCQGWPSRQLCGMLRACQAIPGQLRARRHAWCDREDDRRGAACGRDQSRHNLVSGGSKDPNHDAVIRIGSEAPKRRTHSPFRH